MDINNSVKNRRFYKYLYIAISVNKGVFILG